VPNTTGLGVEPHNQSARSSSSKGASYRRHRRGARNHVRVTAHHPSTGSAAKTIVSGVGSPQLLGAERSMGTGPTGATNLVSRQCVRNSPAHRRCSTAAARDETRRPVGRVRPRPPWSLLADDRILRVADDRVLRVADDRACMWWLSRAEVGTGSGGSVSESSRMTGRRPWGMVRRCQTSAPGDLVFMGAEGGGRSDCPTGQPPPSE